MDIVGPRIAGDCKSAPVGPRIAGDCKSAPVGPRIAGDLRRRRRRRGVRLAVSALFALALTTGCGPETRPGQEVLLHAAWKRRFVGEIVALGMNGAGTLAVVATAPNAKGRGDDRICALDEKGTIAWQQILDHRILDLAVAADGSIIVASLDDGTLRAWKADGDPLWQALCGGTPHLSASGDLIACHGAGEETGLGVSLQVFGAAGKRRFAWSDPAGVWDLGVSETGDGLVGLTQAGKVVALDPDGKVAWTRDLGPVLGAVRLSPGDGTVVIVGTGIEGEKIFAFDRAGAPLWTAVLPGGAETIAVSRGGAFVAAANNTTLGQHVSVFDGHGRLFWSLHLDQPAREPVRVRIDEAGDRVCAAMERDGRPVIASWDGHGDPVGRMTFSSPVADFALSRDGHRLIAVSRGGTLFFYNLR